jgi:hypothetical protein
MNQALIACLTCRSRPRRCRGCCWPCRARHAKAVKAGATTWAELERRGLAAPLEARGQKWMAGFHRWLRAGR